MVLMGKANTTDPLSIQADDSHRLHVFRRLNNFTAEEVRYRLDRYLKFAFVRHPLERLISAYRNKFGANYTSSEYFRSRYGRQIIRQYRANASEESLARGHDVTFVEFVRYVIDPRTASQPGGFNEHWKPQHELCLPCTIRYNIIGKYETLNDDAWLVLEKAGLPWVGGFPRSDRPASTTPLVDEYAAQLTAEELLQLYHIYELDFRLFDYHSAGFGWYCVRSGVVADRWLKYDKTRPCRSLCSSLLICLWTAENFGQLSFTTFWWLDLKYTECIAWRQHFFEGLFFYSTFFLVQWLNID